MSNQNPTTNVSTTNGSIVYRVAQTGSNEGNPNDLFNWTVPVEVKAPEGGIMEKQAKRADIFVIFPSLDGKTIGNLQDRVMNLHFGAWNRFRQYAAGESMDPKTREITKSEIIDPATGEVVRLSLGSLLKTQGTAYQSVKIDGKQETQPRRIFFGVTKEICTDNHDLGLIELVVVKLREWILEQGSAAKSLVIALSYPQSYGSPWNKVKEIYDQHLSDLPCTFIAQVAANQAARPRFERDEELIGEGRQYQVQKVDDAPQADYVDAVDASELEDDQVYDPFADQVALDVQVVETTTVEAEVESELSDEEALTNVQARYDAYEAALNKVRR